MFPDALFTPSAPVAPPKPAEKPASGPAGEPDESFEDVFERKAKPARTATETARDAGLEREPGENLVEEQTATRRVLNEDPERSGEGLAEEADTVPRLEIVQDQSVVAAETSVQNEDTAVTTVPADTSLVTTEEYPLAAKPLSAAALEAASSKTEPLVAAVRSEPLVSPEVMPRPQVAVPTPAPEEKTAPPLPSRENVSLPIMPAAAKPVISNDQAPPAVVAKGADQTSLPDVTQTEELVPSALAEGETSPPLRDRPEPSLAKDVQAAAPRVAAQGTAPAGQIQPPVGTQNTIAEAIQLQPLEATFDPQNVSFDLLRGDTQQASQIRLSQTGSLEPLIARGVDIARNTSSQLIAQLKTDQSGNLEIRLDPPELGRVAVRLYAGEAGMIAQVSAERQDVLDLLRRSEAQLAKEFAEAGYDGLSFDFASEDQTEGWQDSDGLGSAALKDDFDGGHEQDVTTPATSIGSDGRLDIRL